MMCGQAGRLAGGQMGGWMDAGLCRRADVVRGVERPVEQQALDVVNRLGGQQVRAPGWRGVGLSWCGVGREGEKVRASSRAAQPRCRQTRPWRAGTCKWCGRKDSSEKRRGAVRGEKGCASKMEGWQGGRRCKQQNGRMAGRKEVQEARVGKRFLHCAC
eukprot:361300-Chlamydomonas_euryale.AAC.2